MIGIDGESLENPFEQYYLMMVMIYIYIYIGGECSPSTGAGCYPRLFLNEILTGLNLEFSFFYSGCHSKVKESTLPIYPELEESSWNHVFLNEALYEIQTTSSKIWTISNDCKFYISTSIIYIYIYIYTYIYIYIYTYIYIYIYISLRKNKTGHIRIINLFPSFYVFFI